ncbi:hypothetical protein Tco_0906656 [Tanacetum coccineum]|uniref:Reverse transcriptase domain-containing protein n=1 Tax=Tanacetum coccineum TaxID=301880 RepID=A0ABQ5CH29_9ASTR
MAPKRTTRSTLVTLTPNATTTTTVIEAQLQALIDQGVATAMAEAEASRVRNGYNSNGSGPRPSQAVRECSYSEFLKCKPLDFKGTEGVIVLTRWFEKMEFVFSISNCTTSYQVKFATCTLQDDALTWMYPEDVDKIEKLYRVAFARMNIEKKRKYDDLSKNNQNQQQRTQARPTLQAIVTGNHTSGLNLCVPSVITIIKVLVYLGAITAKRLDIWPRIVEADLQMLTTTTATTTTATTTTIIRRAPVKVYVVGNTGANPDNVVAGTFLLNNLYAYILFDMGADQSFVSTAQEGMPKAEEQQKLWKSSW